MSTLKEGDRISNYILEARLGVGSFGEVWRARHHVFEELVAIKVPTDPQYVRNLQHEGVAVHGLKHPNIVRAIDLDPYGNPPYLVMEYVPGPSLRAVIDQLRDKFPISTAVAVMAGVLTALEAAHRENVIHRDVKPANVLLALEPGTDQGKLKAGHVQDIDPASVKVTDFGLGKVGGDTTSSIMQSGSFTTNEGKNIAGTVAYMSPEQKDGRELDGRSDLYACGILFFEMLTGERPQGHDLPSSLRKEMPAHFDEVFRRSYTRLDHRFSSAREMLNALVPTGSEVHQGQANAPSRLADGELRCPNCRSGVQTDDHFCIKCGTQLVASVPRCPNAECRAFVHTRDRFCVFCGTSLQILTD